MANILLLDESDVAGRAMQGILARGNHACFIATKPEDAWKMLRDGVVFDVVFQEVRVGGNAGGLQFLQRLRDDWFWKILPVVIYTADSDSRSVKKALALKVQNYLIKPYNEQSVYAEIAKAMLNPWRNLHFEEAKSFCALMGLAADDLTKMRREVMVGFDQAAQTFPAWAETRQNEEVFTRINALASDAEAAGIWAGVDYLRDLHAQAAVGNWYAFLNSADFLDYASRLIFCQLNPSYAPDCMRSEAEIIEAREGAERMRWENANVDANGAVLDRETLEKQVAALAGCPVIDSTAAAFQMVADGRAANMSQVMDLVASDAGLCAQVLAAANGADHDEMSAIDDPRAAATMLGEIKLHALARALPIAHERHMHLPPLNAAGFSIFQMGVGKVAQFICTYLEMEYLGSQACTAGLVHDLGKLLLLKLHPFGFQAVVRYAREKKVALPVAEQKHLGCTLRELAALFAEKRGLPAPYRDVIRWVGQPDQAGANAELVAIVALARYFCLQHGVGCSGDPAEEPMHLGSSAAWRVLQPRVFPSFEMKKFEVQAHQYCVSLRHELAGRSRVAMVA